jgi:hypothetical protein
MLSSSQRLSAHSADLLSLKRNGGDSGAAGVCSQLAPAKLSFNYNSFAMQILLAVLKGWLPLSSANIALQVSTAFD